MALNARATSIAAEVAKAGVSGLTFLAMAHILGPDTYGLYVQYAAVAMTLIPIATAGYSSWVQPLALRDGLDTAASVVFPLLVMAGLPCLALTVVYAVIFDPMRAPTIGLVIAVEMLVFPLWGFVVLVFLTSESLSHYLLASIAVPLMKLMGTLAALYLYDGSLVAWGAALIPMGLAGLVITIFVARGKSFVFGWRTLRNWLRRGLGFASVGVASSFTDTVDKLVVGFAGGASAAGTYGVASRFSAYGIIPVRAIALVSYPRYFQLAEEGNRPGLRALMYRTIRKSLWLSLPAAGFVAVSFFVASQTILAEYRDSLVVTCVLLLLIPLKGIQYAAGDVTYALGKPAARLSVTVVGGIVTAATVSGGFALGGPLGSATGAVAASIMVAIILLVYVEMSIKKNIETGVAESVLQYSNR